MKIRALFLCILGFLVMGMVSAGDIATYVNLGFSSDSRYFMFGQYGVSDADSSLYAEIYTVDVHTNRFVEGGVAKGSFNVDLQPGQDGLGALLSLLRQSSKLIDTYRIDHMKPGRFVYILINGNDPLPVLDFRDFTSGSSYRVELKQSKIESAGTVSSSFYLDLTVRRKDGSLKGYTVGLPTYLREGVSGYRIQSAFFAPDERSLVFVIEKNERGPAGPDIRYMVETVKLL